MTESHTKRASGWSSIPEGSPALSPSNDFRVTFEPATLHVGRSNPKLELKGFAANPPRSVSKGSPAEKAVPRAMPESISSQAYIDRTLEAVRAQNDARFAEVLGEIRSLSAKIDHVPTTHSMFTTAIAGVAGSVGLVLAVLAFAGDRFDGGLAARSYLDGILTEQRQTDRAQDVKLDTILEQVKRIAEQPFAFPPPPNE